MHTPSGYAINDAGQFIPDDWTAVIFNPSFPYRIVHMVLAAYLTTALVVGGVGAWHLLRDRANEPARLMFSMAMWMVVIVTPLQLVAGDTQGLNTLKHQPAKIAAIEGHFEPERGAPLILFGLPDMAAHETKYKLEIPKLGSLILTHEWDGEVPGLNEWSPRDWPDAPVVFWSFRVMVGLGLLMLGLGAFGLYCRWRRRLYDSPWLHRAAVLMAPAGFLAVLSGWITTEVGRQPFTVYGLLRTQDSASPINAPAVGTSLVAFIVAYFAVFGLGVYYALRLAMKTPSAGVTGPEAEKPVRPPGKALAEEIGDSDGSAKTTGDAP
jgi:cytochrome d ubiquinol oxidase subunit I